jgi:hypothetical protein
MARIDYIKHRLENWALWKARESSGGLGWATTSVLLAERVDRSREIDIYTTIDDNDAMLTNAAVESLRPARPHLYERLYLIYIAGVGVREAARRSNPPCAESTIKASLDQADRALATWFSQKAEQDAIKRAMADQSKKSFTT